MRLGILLGTRWWVGRARIGYPWGVKRREIEVQVGVLYTVFQPLGTPIAFTVIVFVVVVVIVAVVVVIVAVVAFAVAVAVVFVAVGIARDE